MYFDPNKVLWVAIDTSKEFGIGYEIFYIKDDAAFANSGKK